jgi:hypothetical protein
METKDSFSIDVALRHPSHSPETISKALSLKPRASWSAGQSVGTLPAKWTFFHARLREGNGSSDYENALGEVIAFLERNATFWADFMDGNGEVELILNYKISQQAGEGDKCLESYFSPDFLRHLSTRGIGLRIQGWAEL